MNICQRCRIEFEPFKLCPEAELCKICARKNMLDSRKEWNEFLDEVHDKAKELVMFSQKKGRTKYEHTLVGIIDELIDFQKILKNPDSL